MNLKKIEISKIFYQNSIFLFTGQKIFNLLGSKSIIFSKNNPIEKIEKFKIFFYQNCIFWKMRFFLKYHLER